MPRIVKASLAASAIALLLSACEMTVSLDTTLDAGGAGRFGLRMELDKELRDFLASSTDPASGLATVKGLFEGLRASGWSVTTVEPHGGLVLEATKRFADQAAFDRLLGEIRSARGESDSKIGGLKLNLGYRMKRSFLRTRAEFTGVFDTTARGLDPDLLKEIQRVVRFRVRTTMPGVISIGDASGTVREGAAEWEPLLGTSLTFSARATEFRVGQLLMVVVPGLALLVALAWFLLGRRPKEEPLRALRPEPVPTAIEPRKPAIFPEPVDRRISLEPERVTLDAERAPLDE